MVFDLGGVLIDWDPRHLYRDLFDDEDTMEWFLAEVCNDAWNLEQDAGRPFAVGVADAVRRHPAWRSMIEAYFERWDAMIGGAHEETVEVLADLGERGVEVHALTNWSAETFPLARRRFGFLDWFATVLVSGEEKLVKPDLRIFYLMGRRIGRRPQDCISIDDSLPNVVAAAKVGFDAIHYRDGPALRQALVERGLLTG